jgi:flagellar basal body-associated protein FliL
VRSKRLIIIAIVAVVLVLAIAGSAYALVTECSLNGLCDPTTTTSVAPAAGSAACPMGDDAACAGTCARTGGGCCGR